MDRGTSVKALQEAMRHKHAETTLGYCHGWMAEEFRVDAFNLKNHLANLALAARRRG